jgi:hypothetical protein
LPNELTTLVCKKNHAAQHFDGEVISDVGGVRVSKKLYDLPSGPQNAPFDPEIDWPFGPEYWSHRYSLAKEFWPFKYHDESCDCEVMGVLWQALTNYANPLGQIYVSIISDDGEEISNTRVYGIADGIEIQGAAFDGVETILFLGVTDGHYADVIAYKVNVHSGEIIMQRTLDTSEHVTSSSTGIDVFERFACGGSCIYTKGKVGCILARTMHNRHQGAYAFRLDFETLDMFKYG